MRRLRRPAVTPPTLSGTGRGAAKASEHVRKRAANPGEDLDFPEFWNEPDVRGALHAMQGWACAYCQRQLEHDRGYVDHFRPKRGGRVAGHGGYWWLAYAFGNYLLSCGICNSNCKSNKFPLAPGAQRVDHASRAMISTEARLLIDPAEDPVEDWIRVDWMSSLEEGVVKVRPSVREGSVEKLRATMTIDFFRLNESYKCRRLRRLAIDDVLRALKQRDREMVHRLACRYLPLGAVAHNVIEDAEPSWLPTPKEELLVFLEELRKKLKDAHEAWQTNPSSDRCGEDVDELLWTFAVLWKDPPPDTLTATEIERWLDARGLEALVEGKLAKL